MRKWVWAAIRQRAALVLGSAEQGDGLKTLWTLAWVSIQAVMSSAVTIPIAVPVSSTGFVSVALLDTNGVMVRNLAHAEPTSAGTRTFFWDGTTDLGWPAPVGEYTTRAVFFTNAPALKFFTKVGTSGNPPWRLKDGTGDWGGDLGGPSAIAANSSSLMVVWSAVENYTLPGLQQIDTNGNVLRSYISFYPYDGRMAAAMDENELYLGILNRSQQRIEIARYELGTSNKTILAHLPTPPHFTFSGRFKNRWQAMLDGLAITPTRLFASSALDDRLFILERGSGEILHEINLPAPRGLAVIGNRLLVVSSNRVLRVRFDGEVEATLIETPLMTEPYAITVDRTGNIYVSDGAAQRLDPEAFTGSHRIYVFDANGEHLRTIGAPGGSPRSGVVNRLGFGDIRSICIGPDDKLWVQEQITGFKRTSRWNTNGVLEREWFQRKLTHYTDLLNPARPDELIYPANGFEDYPALTAHRVNWTNGAWEPAWSWAQTQDEMYQEEIFLSNDHSNPLQQYQPGKRQPVFHYAPTELVTFAGRNYFMNHSGNGEGAIFTYSETNAPQPVALVGFHRVSVITNKIVSHYDTGPNQWITWADADGNGRMASNEFRFASGSSKLALSMRVYDAKLEANLNVRLLRSIGTNVFLESVLPLKELLPNGAPVYDWAMLQDLALRKMPSFEGADGWKRVRRINDVQVPVEDGDAVYSLIDPTPFTSLSLPSLDHFWADRNWRKRIAKFERSTGKFLWAAGHRAPHRARPGEMYNPYGITVSHNAIFVADVLGMIWTWSSDGLFLGRLSHDAEPGRTWDEYAIHVELQGPVTLFTNQATGKLYLIVNDAGAHIYELTLPSLEALPATSVSMTPEIASRVRARDPDLSAPLAGSALLVTHADTNVVISWHTNAGGLVLQSSAGIGPPWTTHSESRTTNGENVTVTLPRSSERRFFRLLN